jgi:phosphate transport system ATP-binding protein
MTMVPKSIDAATWCAGHTCANATGACAAMTIEGLGLAYAGRWAFRGLDLTIPSCRITAVVGPSGCGKSSLLSCLNRLDELTAKTSIAGRVLIGGQDIRAPRTDLIALRRRIGMIFQRPNPFPLSIINNLDLPLREHGCRDRGERHARSERALRAVGLWDEVKDRLTTGAQTLSGGQQQRLCLARALVLQPEILLLDEPCSSLDPLAAGVIEDLLETLKGFYTVVLVTHDLAQARRVADHVAVLWPGEHGGRLVASGGRDLLTTPPQHLDPQTAGYLLGTRTRSVDPDHLGREAVPVVISG